jgi:hypothetical protein
MLKTFIVLVVMLFIICFGFSLIYADNNELFTDTYYSADLNSNQEKLKMNTTIIRSRYIQVKFAYLARKNFPQGVEPIVLNLFHDVSLEAVKERVEMRSAKQYTWYGHIEGMKHSQVVVVVENGNMVGNISAEGKVYQIRVVDKGVHVIYEIDQNSFPENAPPIPIETPDTLYPTPLASQVDDSSIPIIDVMVVYTDDAARASPNIPLEIQLAIDETNQSYINSNINQRLRLVHSAEVSYTETGDMNADLNCISSKIDGCLDEIHTWRDTYGADIVSLWVENGGPYCGMAWLMEIVSTYFQQWAFSVVTRSCATGIYAFGHELGHNMGAHHDRYVTTRLDPNDQGVYPYSHGYVNTSDRWRTIMAYNTECSDNGFYCSILPYWSNPDVLYGGFPMGIPEEQADAADNRKTLNNTAYTVANFRQPVVECNLVPDGTVIPRGGTLGFQATITNNTDEVQVFKFATRITKPNGGKAPPTGYLKGPVRVRLDPHNSGSKHISQFIPSTAPLGMYTYHGYIGRSGVVYNECQFDFEVVE